MTFPEARALVLKQVRHNVKLPAVEFISLDDAPNRILAAEAAADRDYPPFHRATRDGFAVRSEDLPGEFEVVGESKAGARFEGAAGSRQAVEIMTGAPVPEGVDAIVMVEHVTRPRPGTMVTNRTLTPHTNIAAAGCEARAGAVILVPGTRLDYSSVGWLATIGLTAVPVYRKLRVAILATGDEIVETGVEPGPDQIRNSNAHTLAAQVRRAGADPVTLPIARDDKDATADLIRRGVDCDMLLLSGGVSAGKYDFVEPALHDLGADFFFDHVDIQPGRPVVFGKVLNKFFFGLPGNPASTMVTFELFARGAIEILSGCNDAPLQLTLARLTRRFTHKAGLTRFLPAILSRTEVTPVDWQGSGDVPSICRANAFIVADSEHPEYAAGDLISVLLK